MSTYNLQSLFTVQAWLFYLLTLSTKVFIAASLHRVSCLRESSKRSRAGHVKVKIEKGFKGSSFFCEVKGVRMLLSPLLSGWYFSCWLWYRVDKTFHVFFQLYSLDRVPLCLTGNQKPAKAQASYTPGVWTKQSVAELARTGTRRAHRSTSTQMSESTTSVGIHLETWTGAFGASQRPSTWDGRSVTCLSAKIHMLSLNLNLKLNLSLSPF